uniref:Uncharacterized protein n=1 Tax=Bubo bubo TaxID=30461 RepID=A0A8C0EKB3_BUBBB
PRSESFPFPARPQACSREPSELGLFALMDIAWWCNGWVLVVEVDDDNMRTPSVLADVAQDLCGTGDRAKLQLVKRMEEEEEEKVQPRLVFMLWQANMLKQLVQWDHLDEALWDVRNLLPSLPEVLVLVMIEPDPQEQLGQALRALRRMQCLLYGAWQLPVEAAVYSPGQPDGILEAKRAACRALREVLNFHEVSHRPKLCPGCCLLFFYRVFPPVEVDSQGSVTAVVCLNIGNTRYQRRRMNSLGQ